MNERASTQRATKGCVWRNISVVTNLDIMLDDSTGVYTAPSPIFAWALTTAPATTTVPSQLPEEQMLLPTLWPSSGP